MQENNMIRRLTVMKRIFMLMFLPAALLISCQKDPKTVPAGTVRLLITVSHHGYPISNAVVFKKNNTLVFPGQDTTLYDERYVTDGEGKLTIDHIGNGYKQLVVYAKGFDPAWDSTHATPVWGYQYTSFTTANGESRDIPITIPVSE